MSSGGAAGEGTPRDMTPSLIGRLRQGDAEAAALLNDLYRDALYRFCWGYLGTRDAAEDAVQEVCYKVLTARNVPEHFRPWIYRVARNHCLNTLRRRRRHGDDKPLPAASQLHQALTGQLSRLAHQEEQHELINLLEGLSESHQEVLRLRYVENLSRADIADILELPESVVKSRLFEGLKKLRTRLDANADSD